MRVNVKNYIYRWLDNMLILQTEDDNILYIYCPSECIYNDGISRYYCYKENLQARELLEIDYVDYHTESDLVDIGITEMIMKQLKIIERSVSGRILYLL